VSRKLGPNYGSKRFTTSQLSLLDSFRCKHAMRRSAVVQDVRGASRDDLSSRLELVMLMDLARIDTLRWKIVAISSVGDVLGTVGFLFATGLKLVKVPVQETNLMETNQDLCIPQYQNHPEMQVGGII
jgi:hypothetical protein